MLGSEWQTQAYPTATANVGRQEKSIVVQEEMREISRHVKGPLVANMLERGVTPLLSPQELLDLGFQLVVWPLSPLYAVAKTLADTYSTLRQDGSTTAILDRLMAFDDFNAIVGLEEKYEVDRKYK